MEQENKTPLYAPIALFFLFLVLPLYGIIDCIQIHHEYNRIKDELVETKAYVQDIIYDTTAEYDDYSKYIVTVEYTYDSQTYSDRFKTRDEDDYYENQEISVTINPYKPDRLYEYDGNCWSICLILVLMLSGGILAMISCIRSGVARIKKILGQIRNTRE